MATVQDVLSQEQARLGQNGTETWNWWNNNVYNAGTGWAWCAAFQDMCLSYAGVPHEHSASAANICLQFQQIDDSQVQAGDLVFFGWDGIPQVYHRDNSHVAMVESFDHNSQWFTVLEGNGGANDNWSSYVKRTNYYNLGNFYTAFFRPSYGGSPSPKPTPTSDKWLQAYTTKWWTPYSGGITAEGDDFCGDDQPIYGIRSSNPIQVHVIGGGWLNWVDGISPEGDDFAGEDLAKKMPIDGIRVKGMKVRVLCQGQRDYYGWYEYGKPTPEGDDFAGEFGKPIVRIQLG